MLFSCSRCFKPSFEALIVLVHGGDEGVIQIDVEVKISGRRSDKKSSWVAKCIQIHEVDRFPGPMPSRNHPPVPPGTQNLPVTYNGTMGLSGWGIE